MAKLTQKEKIIEGFMALCAFDSFVDRVLYYAKDYDCSELKSMANSAKKEVEEYRKKLR